MTLIAEEARRTETDDRRRAMPVVLKALASVLAVVLSRALQSFLLGKATAVRLSILRAQAEERLVEEAAQLASLGAEAMELFQTPMPRTGEEMNERRTFAARLENVAVDQVEAIGQLDEHQVELHRQTKGHFVLEESQFLDDDRPARVSGEEVGEERRGQIEIDEEERHSPLRELTPLAEEAERTLTEELRRSASKASPVVLTGVRRTADIQQTARSQAIQGTHADRALSNSTETKRIDRTIGTAHSTIASNAGPRRVAAAEESRRVHERHAATVKTVQRTLGERRGNDQQMSETMDREEGEGNGERPTASIGQRTAFLVEMNDETTE